jgi:hypothetical protein
MKSRQTHDAAPILSIDLVSIDKYMIQNKDTFNNADNSSSSCCCSTTTSSSLTSNSSSSSSSSGSGTHTAFTTSDSDSPSTCVADISTLSETVDNIVDTGSRNYMAQLRNDRQLQLERISHLLSDCSQLFFPCPTKTPERNSSTSKSKLKSDTNGNDSHDHDITMDPMCQDFLQLWHTKMNECYHQQQRLALHIKLCQRQREKLENKYSKTAKIRNIQT